MGVTGLASLVYMDDQNNNKKTEQEDKLSLCEKERDEYLNGWKRAKADLINAKKEWEEQIKNLGNFVKADTAGKLLPILDALEGAKEIEGWNEIRKLAEDTFQKIGLEEIKAVGEEFNPEYHESVGGEDGEGHKIVEVVQKGYKIGDKIIRPAKVKIGKSN